MEIEDVTLTELSGCLRQCNVPVMILQKYRARDNHIDLIRLKEEQ